MKQVRVTIRFVEVNDQYELVENRYNMDTKYGAIATEFMGPPEAIAQKLSDEVYRVVNNHFPKFLTPALLGVEEL